MRIYRKGQLRLREEENADQKNPLSVDAKSTGTLQKSISDANRDNSERRNLSVRMDTLTNGTIPEKNEDSTMEIANDSTAASKITQMAHNAQTAPGEVILKNNNNMSESVTFSKSELDKFLRTI